MIRISYILAVLVLCGCAQNRALDFHIKVIPSEGVDPRIARKIVLQYALESRRQYGGWVLEVNRNSGADKEMCFNTKILYGSLKEFCGADYSVATVYKPLEGFMSYPVIEKCVENTCTYTIGKKPNGGFEE